MAPKETAEQLSSNLHVATVPGGVECPAMGAPAPFIQASGQPRVGSTIPTFEGFPSLTCTRGQVRLLGFWGVLRGTNGPGGQTTSFRDLSRELGVCARCGRAGFYP